MKPQPFIEAVDNNIVDESWREMQNLPGMCMSQAMAAGSSWGISWAFDAWGNRLTQTPTGVVIGKIGTQTIGYTNNRNNANTYDAAGNQTNDGLHNYAFTAENQIISMDGGATVYAYDGEGRRMKKVTATETT